MNTHYPIYRRPLDEKGIVFPVNSENEYVYKPPMTTTTMPPPTTLPTLFIEPEELPSREVYNRCFIVSNN